jgi:carbon-monoxide dehydrogenase medium subunit
MIPAEFAYDAPDTLDAAVEALRASDGDGMVLAGGQSLMPLLRLRLAYPESLIDLGRVPDLTGVRDDGDHLRIGAMTTYAEIVTDPLVRANCPLLAQAAATVGDPAIRHRGTLGGALAHADPAGDLPAVAVALGAELILQGPGGTRVAAAPEFFVDYLSTTRGPDELVVAVRVPKLPGWGTHYAKFSRTAQAWAIVAVAAAVKVTGGTVEQARVGLTNMGPTPVRAREVESAIQGAPATREALRAAAAHADDGTQPPSDLHGQADYRRHLARELTERALVAAVGL